MRITVDHHHYIHWCDDDTKQLLNSIIKKLNTMALSHAELAQQLTDVATQVEKSKAEITTKIADLEAAIQNAGNTTQEVDNALAALKTAVQGVDDIVPDQPTT